MSFLATLLTAPALLQAPPPPPFPLLDPRLNLDADQRAKIEALLTQHRDALQARRQALEGCRRALREAIADPNRTPAELEALLIQEAAAHRAAALGAHALLREAAQVLRPEQREAVSKLGPREPHGPGRRPEPRP